MFIDPAARFLGPLSTLEAKQIARELGRSEYFFGQLQSAFYRMLCGDIDPSEFSFHAQIVAEGIKADLDRLTQRRA